jgi:hypothetical protein
MATSMVVEHILHLKRTAATENATISSHLIHTYIFSDAMRLSMTLQVQVLCFWKKARKEGQKRHFSLHLQYG